MKKEMILRWTFFFVGLMVLALGVALTIEGQLLGIGPWDVFHFGLSMQFGLTIGSWSILTGFLLLTIASIIMKKVPRLGTFLNMLLLGLFTDFFIWLLPSIHSFIGVVLSFIVGVTLIGYGIGLYVSADFGSGPRDGIMILLVEKTGWSVQWVRNGMEILVLMLGWALGGPIGIGTVLIAFLLGPIVGVSLPQCDALLKHLLMKEDREKLAA